MTDLKSLFLLDPSVIFLNHGSFGATPRPVFDAWQALQRQMEAQPVLFLGRQFPALDGAARAALAAALNAPAADLAFVPNATTGVNIVARSLHFQPGDEVLTSDQEYGACEYALEAAGATLIRTPIPPGSGPAGVLERLESRVSRRTRLVFLSHITSPTAQLWPAAAVCAWARSRGLPSLIDGAHVPGQLPLDLSAVAADFYTGNAHKWLMAPKGAAFLYTRPEQQARIQPLTVSWGYRATPTTTSGSTYIDYLQWTGTRDPSASLTVPHALEFQRAWAWDTVRQECRRRLEALLPRLDALTGQPSLYADPAARPPQMAAFALPPTVDAFALKEALYDRYRIEIPAIVWNGHPLLRLSVQGYNTPADLEALLDGLGRMLS